MAEESSPEQYSTSAYEAGMAKQIIQAGMVSCNSPRSEALGERPLRVHSGRIQE